MFLSEIFITRLAQEELIKYYTAIFDELMKQLYQMCLWQTYAICMNADVTNINPLYHPDKMHFARIVLIINKKMFQDLNCNPAENMISTTQFVCHVRIYS